LARLLNATGTDFEQTKVEPKGLVEMIDLIDKGTLSTKLAKTVFEEMFGSGRSASAIVAENGLTQVSDSSEIDAMIQRAIDDNPKAVADLVAGKEQALKFLVGQVMKLTKGRANPQMVNNLLSERFK
jgi:aspartyl-tRNA(Asn)/glutamyl-tRNA(Gln) amidotransferase subunit B